jgi:hypothetical protein
MGFSFCNKGIDIASIPLQFPCQGILDSRIARDFGFDSLVQGIFDVNLQGFFLGIPLPRHFLNFQLAK